MEIEGGFIMLPKHAVRVKSEDSMWAPVGDLNSSCGTMRQGPIENHDVDSLGFWHKPIPSALEK